MVEGLAVLLIAWAVAGGSPGPATLAISGTSMGLGRRAGLTLAAGVVCGSASWGIAAGLGLSAMMLAHAWVFELLRYAGAGYLGFLALKSLRSAWQGGAATVQPAQSRNRLFTKGLALHLTNPKAIFSWGAVYAVALPAGADMGAVWSLFGALIAVSMLVFFGYALLFSAAPIARGYARAKRGFDLVFGLLFGAAAAKIFTTRLEAP
ncbi:LysE family translocator [Thalassobius sp. MITS945101]|uniref:LysE family translocator n=1 Tax=Thalassobius sp. MITS945101 TaxID=3096994 RepID=UPI00399AAE2A